MKKRFRYFVQFLVVSIVASFLGHWILSVWWQFLLVVGLHFGLLALAMLWIVFRLTNYARREQAIYIFIGTVNLWLGIASIILYATGKVNRNMPEMMSINLLFGITMLIDSLFLPRKPYEKSP